MEDSDCIYSGEPDSINQHPSRSTANLQKFSHAKSFIGLTLRMIPTQLNQIRRKRFLLRLSTQHTWS